MTFYILSILLIFSTNTLLNCFPLPEYQTAFRFVRNHLNKTFIQRHRIELLYGNNNEPESNHEIIDEYQLDYDTLPTLVGMNMLKRKGKYYLHACFYFKSEIMLDCYRLYETRKLKLLYSSGNLTRFSNVDTATKLYLGYHDGVACIFATDEKDYIKYLYNSVTEKWNLPQYDAREYEFGKIRYSQFEGSVDIENRDTGFKLRNISVKLEYDYILDLNQVSKDLIGLPEVYKPVGFRYCDFGGFCYIEKYDMKIFYSDWHREPFFPNKVPTMMYKIDCFDGYTSLGMNFLKIDDKYYLHVCFYFKSSSNIICQYLNEDSKFVTNFNATMVEFESITNPSRLFIGYVSKTTDIIINILNDANAGFGMTIDKVKYTDILAYDSVLDQFEAISGTNWSVSSFGNHRYIQQYYHNIHNYVTDLVIDKAHIHYTLTEYHYPFIYNENRVSKDSIVLPSKIINFPKLSTTII